MTSSKLECLGLAPPGEDDVADLLVRVKHLIRDVGRVGGVLLAHYTDPSGARINIELPEDGDVAAVIPSYVAPAGAELRRIANQGAGALVVGWVEEDVGGGPGATDTVEIPVGCQLVQWRLLRRRPIDAAAAITAFGVDVAVHDDAAAYLASRPEGSLPFGPDTFIPIGMFGEAPVTASAQLHGTVLSAQTHTVALTGRTFHACRVTTVGFQAEVVLAATAHPRAPHPGAVIAGSVELVADAASIIRVRRRRSWLR